ncbi:two-component system response regulator [Companilactobacillus allii]|uniref:Two-component system response regulator n=2 Tax=Companilactobacillus allii TaxID=1847728 RepID=A0A1P8PZX8_9LACO|nr:two-component system response regulator [Companilactobacillus allii]
MRPLVLLSKNLPLFIEMNSYCNSQGWFIHNMTSPQKTVEMVDNNNVSGLIWDLATTDLQTSLEILEKIRNKVDGPIIVLSPIKKRNERKLFYDINVDSYLVAPLEYPELIAKFKQLFWVYDKFAVNEARKQLSRDTNTTVKCHDLSIDLKHYRVSQSGNDLGLTPKEFSILWYLMQHRGQVLSRDQLIAGVWGYDNAGSTRTIDIHISHLRDKLEKNPQEPQWIKTVRGFGYILNNDYPLVSVE